MKNTATRGRLERVRWRMIAAGACAAALSMFAQTAQAARSAEIPAIHLDIRPLAARSFYVPDTGISIEVMTPKYNRWGDGASMTQLPALVTRLQSRMPATPLIGITEGGQVAVLPRSPARIVAGTQVALTSGRLNAAPKTLKLEATMAAPLQALIRDGNYRSAYRLLSEQFDRAKAAQSPLLETAVPEGVSTHFDHPEKIAPAINQLASMFRKASFWGTGYWKQAGTSQELGLHGLNAGIEVSPSGDRIVIRRSFWPGGGRHDTSDAFSEQYLTLIAGNSPGLFISDKRGQAPGNPGEERYKTKGLVERAALDLKFNQVTLRATLPNGGEATYRFRKSKDGSLQVTETFPTGTTVMRFKPAPRN